jgi:hypothetical protein
MVPGQSAIEVKTLKGLEGVKVLVERIPPEIEAEGLKAEELKEEVEQALKLAGVKVLTEAEHYLDGRHPTLYAFPHMLKVDSDESDLPFYLYSLRLEVQQWAVLGELYSSTQATTWTVSFLGITSEMEIIRERLGELVELFTEAFLTANPKPTKEQ